MDNSKNKIIAIIDYRLNNLNSVKNCLRKMKCDFFIITSEENFIDATHYILPGVGSFNLAMRNIKNMKIISRLKDNIIKDEFATDGITIAEDDMTK